MTPPLRRTVQGGTGLSPVADFYVYDPAGAAGAGSAVSHSSMIAFYAYDTDRAMEKAPGIRDPRAARFAYDDDSTPFPHHADRPSATSTRPRLRTSIRTYDMTGLSYYGYRYYSPGLGRFLSRDPIGEGGGVGVYGFAGNSPLEHVDLYGLTAISVVSDTDVAELPPTGGGETWGLFEVSLTLPGAGDYAHDKTEEGCPTGMKQLKTVHETEWNYRIRILRGKRYQSTPRNPRRTVEAHEWEHFAITRRHVEWQDSQIRVVSDTCVCRACYSALLDLVIAVRVLAGKWDDADNDQLDCGDTGYRCTEAASERNDVIDFAMRWVQMRDRAKAACTGEDVNIP